MENGAEVECEAPQDGQIKSNGVDGVDKSKSNDEPQAVAAENGSTDPDESSTPPVIDESQEVTTEDSPDPLAEPPELEKVPEANENGVDSSSEDPLKEDVEMSELKPETVDEQTMDAEQPKHVPSGKEPKEDEVPEDEASDDAAAEEQPSSTSSSPSALHIHLDEEDKDESLNGTTTPVSSAPAMELTSDLDKDGGKETPDPTLPLISSVVSLSSMTSQAPLADATSDSTPSKQQPSPPPPASVSPTPSTESNGLSTTRTTLRLKRGIEISFDVDKNGQPVAVNHQRGDSSAPSGSSSSSGEPREKRVRVDDEDDEDLNQPDLSELDCDGTNTLLAAVQRDIRTLRFMAKQKEKEWNYILKLMKVKEELQAKLMRHREVMKITSASARRTILPSAAHLQQVVAQSQVHQPAAAASLQTLINQSLNVMMSAGASSKPSSLSKSDATASGSQSGRHLPHHQPHLSIHQQQQQQQLQLQQQAQQQMQSLYQQQQQAKLNPRQRPILPKPSLQVQPEVQIWSHHASSSSHHHHHAALVDSVVAGDPLGDPRNKQGTVSVQSLIADYRAKHPEEIPTRGRRVRQSSRIGNDPNSSSSPPPGNLQQPVDPASGMSFKDVLLQFAKMSSRQGHPSANDLVQLGKESPGSCSTGGLLSGAANSSGSGSSSSSAAALQSLAAANSAAANSSAAALQSLAAARNARSSPHATNLSAGSILQSALSGAARGTNPSFAPTLAQLLTNPANEQQQPQAPPPQQQALALTSATPAISVTGAGTQSSSSASAAASAAEVLTLSNLLATAKGGTTGSTERGRGQASLGSASASASVNAANSNYMRTSGGGEVPRCQGCNERVAQFVCAGCSSQWYCSRECQVAAWEEHSEHCVG